MDKQKKRQRDRIKEEQTDGKIGTQIQRDKWKNK
jgi:hypothetical protein